MAYAAMKAGKLQKIREHHSSEEVEIAKSLQTIKFFKDVLCARYFRSLNFARVC